MTHCPEGFTEREWQQSRGALARVSMPKLVVRALGYEWIDEIGWYDNNRYCLVLVYDREHSTYKALKLHVSKWQVVAEAALAREIAL